MKNPENETVMIAVEHHPYTCLTNEYDNFHLRELIHQHCQASLYLLYPPAVLINKTDVNLMIRLENKLIMGVGAGTSGYVWGDKGEVRVGKSGEWSKVFDIKTLGLTGCIEVRKKKKDNTFPRVQTFGVLIESCSSGYTHTKAIKIVPRYMFYNNLDESIIVKQKNHSTYTKIMPKEKKVWYFEDKDQNAMVMIRDINQEG